MVSAEVPKKHTVSIPDQLLFNQTIIIIIITVIIIIMIINGIAKNMIRSLSYCCGGRARLDDGHLRKFFCEKLPSWVIGRLDGHLILQFLCGKCFIG